jgi:hypothetical protein
VITSTFPMTATPRPRSLAVDTCMRAYPQTSVFAGTNAEHNAAVAAAAVKNPVVGTDVPTQGDRPPRGVPR